MIYAFVLIVGVSGHPMIFRSDETYADAAACEQSLPLRKQQLQAAFDKHPELKARVVGIKCMPDPNDNSI